MLYRWAKSGSVVEQGDSEIILISLNIECQEAQPGESLFHAKRKDIVTFHLS